MSDFSIRGEPVVRATLYRTRMGIWSIEAKVATDRLDAGEAVFQAGTISMRGRIVADGDYAASAPVFLSGCRGGLLRNVAARSYARGIPAREVLRDLLRDIREELSPDTQDSILSRELPGWMRRAGAAETALTLLVRELGPGVVWRTDNDGRIWIGVDTWEELVTSPDSVILEISAPDMSWERWALDEPILQPGQLHRGRRIYDVEYTVEAEQFRATTFYTTDETAEGRLRLGFETIVRQTFPAYPFLSQRRAEVRNVEQPMAAEVHFADPDFDDMRAQILAPAPGAKITPRAGDECIVLHADADPSGAQIQGWLSDGANAKPVARQGDHVDCGEITWTGATSGTVGTLTGVYTDCDGNTDPNGALSVSGAFLVVPPKPIIWKLKGKIVEGSSILSVE